MKVKTNVKAGGGGGCGGGGGGGGCCGGLINTGDILSDNNISVINLGKLLQF
jgi:hypothetical protein